MLTLTLLATTLMGILSQSQARSPPNIIMILADDLGWNDVSFHGSNQIKTPNIDQLAYSGVILNNYYVQPICTPTRSALMTGRYPIHTGLQTSVIVAAAPYGLPLNISTLPDHLRKLGYENHVVGKWHLGFYAKEYTPTYRGFDSFYGYYAGMGDYFDHSEGWGLDWGFDMHHDVDKNVKLVDRNEVFGKYSTELYTDRAIKVIKERDQSKPLFLYLAHQAVHSANVDFSLQAPTEYTYRFPNIWNTKRRTYAGVVSALDDSVGKLMAALKEADMLDNTVVFFSTDNGGPANGFDKNYASNWPLRGVKNTLWEGGVRGTGFVWSPLLKKPQRVSDQLLHVTDFTATMIGLAGGDPGSLGIDGIDAWRHLSEGAPSPRNEVLLNIEPSSGSFAIRQHNWKLIHGDLYRGQWNSWYRASGEYPDQLNKQDNPDPRAVNVNCGVAPAKTTCTDVGKQVCLFDVATDPCEFFDVADKHPEVVAALRARVEAYRKGMVKPLNKPLDPMGSPRYHNFSWVPWVELS